METKKRRNKQSCCILSNHNSSTRSRITEQILVRFFHSCSWLLFALMRSILNSYFKTNSLMLCTSTNNKIDCFEIIPTFRGFIFFLNHRCFNLYLLISGSEILFGSDRRLSAETISKNQLLILDFLDFSPLTENPHLFRFEELFLPPRDWFGFCRWSLSLFFFVTIVSGTSRWASKRRF